MNQQSHIGRRAWIEAGIAMVGGAAAVPALAASSKVETTGHSTRPILTASNTNAVVETSAGKIHGYTRNGIQTFKGIPYAATTAGAARFLPPEKPRPWTGIRSTMQYGPVSPQPPRTGWSNDEVAFLFNWNDGIPSEDCLRLNIWTPGLNDNRKRPVMVWMHGGGFVAGNGQEHPGYDGENLSRRGDVVVVSLNHRLGVLGYLNLAEYGGRYASSANVGNLDLVAALEWVRDNIAQFGGDPSNVTIFGQSGGGGKVTTLMAMPAAKGLFHRAIVESGSSLRQATPDRSAKLAAAVIAELGLSGSSLDRIHELPYEQLVQAGTTALKKLQPERTAPGSGMGFNWGPTVDGKILPTNAWDPVAPSVSADVPLLVGTTLNEFTTAMGNPELESMTAEELRTRVSAQHGDKTDRILEAFRRAHPGGKPFDLYSLISTARVRQNAVTQADRKAALGKAPAYLYLFAWQTPVLDGRPRAFHCSEIAFAFYNTDVAASMTGGSAEARELSAKVSDAWINFARKGDPNHAGLPKWPAFSAANEPTMIFDNKCEARNHFDTETRRAVVG